MAGQEYFAKVDISGLPKEALENALRKRHELVKVHTEDGDLYVLLLRNDDE